MKRIAARVVVFLLLGAVVNVAVAWGQACRLPPADVRIQRIRIYPDIANLDPALLASNDPADRMKAINHMGSYSVGRIAEIHLNEMGWPCLSMHLKRSSKPTKGWENGLRVPEALQLKRTDAIPPLATSENPRFPTLPLWPGFAINTIFYAAVLWVMYTTPFALRRRLRIRRGLCPACAYPIGTSPVCTECGVSVILRKEVSR